MSESSIINQPQKHALQWAFFNSLLPYFQIRKLGWLQHEMHEIFVDFCL